MSNFNLETFLNLAAWYALEGGMQDFNYWTFGCAELTVEVACCKYPPASQLQAIWLQNQKSLVEYLKMANTGVRGVITFQNGQPASFLTVRIDGREPYFKTSQTGEYYRILLAGSYNLSLWLDCSTQLYQQTIYVPPSTNLLVLNLTLSNDIYNKWIGASLNKYSVFCTSGMPESCLNGYSTDKNMPSTVSYNSNSLLNESSDLVRVSKLSAFFYLFLAISYIILF